MQEKKNNIWPQILTTQTGHYLYLNCLSSYLCLKFRLCFIETKGLVRITFNGLINDRRSILTILQLNNGCSYQDAVLAAILRYFKSFSNQTFHSFCFKERFFIRWPLVFRLKIGSFSKVTGRILALRAAHG